jgi:FOG: TPR repeat, SEL1 subfamily
MLCLLFVNIIKIYFFTRRNLALESIARKGYGILSFVLFMVCSFSAAKATKGQESWLEPDNLVGQPPAISWEALYHKALHAPEEIQNNATLQNQLLTYYFHGYSFCNPAIFAAVIPDLKAKALSDIKALWLVLKYEFKALGYVSDDTVPLVKALKRRKDAEALLVLTQCYNQGWGVEQNYEKCLNLLKTLVEQGNSRAQGSLGFAYFTGQGVQQDQAKGVYWWRRAAKQGNALAQYNLGVAYCNGQGVDQNFLKAVRLWRRAAKQGNATAQYNLGMAHSTGQGVEQDYAKAARLWHQASRQGHAEAHFKLGLAYYEGQGVVQDHKAAFWYSLLAKQGKPLLSGALDNIKQAYRATVIPYSIAGNAAFIYDLEQCPLRLFEDPSQPNDLSTRLAQLNRTSCWDEKGAQQIVGPAILPSSLKQRLADLYNNIHAIRKLLEETLPHDLSRSGFLITNLKFDSPLISPAAESPYVQTFTIKDQAYLCLGEANIKAAQNIFTLLSNTEAAIDPIVERLNISVETLAFIPAAMDAKDPSEGKLHEHKAYYQKAIATLGDLKRFVQQSKNFVDDTLIASTPQRDKGFADEYGSLLN